MNSLTVVKSNKLIRAGYKLSINEQRLLLLGISKINPTQSINHENGVIITAQEFSTIYGSDIKKTYTILKKSTNNLFKRYITLSSPSVNEPDREIMLHWVNKIIRSKGSGTVTLFFHKEMIPYLTQLKSQFTQYRLQEISCFKSIYGIRLYEFLIQWKSKTVFKISIDELRKCFQLESKQYNRFYNFKKRCIEPALLDINNFSSYKIEDVAYIRRGKSFVEIEFNFCEKGKISNKKQNESFRKMEKFLDSNGDIFNFPKDSLLSKKRNEQMTKDLNLPFGEKKECSTKPYSKSTQNLPLQ